MAFKVVWIATRGKRYPPGKFTVLNDIAKRFIFVLYVDLLVMNIVIQWKFLANCMLLLAKYLIHSYLNKHANMNITWKSNHVHCLNLFEIETHA